MTLLYLTLVCLTYSTWLYSTWLYSTWLYSTWLYSTWLYSTWHYSTWFYSTWHYSTWLYSTWHYSTWLYSTWLYSTWLYSTWHYSTWLYSTWLYSTWLYSTWLYSTWLYSTWLYSTWLYSTWLYSTWLNFTEMSFVYRKFLNLNFLWLKRSLKPPLCNVSFVYFYRLSLPSFQFFIVFLPPLGGIFVIHLRIQKKDTETEKSWMICMMTFGYINFQWIHCFLQQTSPWFCFAPELELITTCRNRWGEQTDSPTFQRGNGLQAVIKFSAVSIWGSKILPTMAPQNLPF